MFAHRFTPQNSKYEFYIVKAEELRHDDFVKAKLYADSALSFANHLNDNTLIARAYNELCNLFSASGKHKEYVEVTCVE